LKLEKWLKSNTPNTKSKFDTFKNDMIELRKEGFSYPQITEYLKSNGVKCNHTEVLKYLKKEKGGKQNEVHHITSPLKGERQTQEQENSKNNIKNQNLDEIMHKDIDLSEFL